MRLQPPATRPLRTLRGGLVITLLALATGGPVSGEPASREQARAARQKALSQPRRIIFNDDTYELSRDGVDTPEEFLKRRLKPLVGTHVDVISWSVLGGWADAPVYDSKVQPIYGEAHGGPPKYWPKVAENVKALIKTGHCPLQIAIDFAHGNGMELFASVRMNDCHDSFISGGSDGVTLWKKAHREFWVDPGDVPKNDVSHPFGLYTMALDFSHQEVRDRKFEIIQEVCQRYDVDGVDLNFMRHPVFFSRTMRDEPVTEAELEKMTALVRRIRRFTDERARLRGRPILVAAILPDTLQQSKHLGLDVKTWIEEDLVDILIPGLGYSPFSVPVEELIDLAQRHGKKVYPCINRKAPQKVPDEFISEGFRGAATNWYAVGADGIFFWNLGTPFEHKLGEELERIRNQYYAALPQLGDPRSLTGKDKLFAVDDPVRSYYRHVSSRSPLPLQLKPGKPQMVSLVVREDFQEAARRDRLEELRLLVWLKRPAEAASIKLRLGGQLLQNPKLAERDSGESRFDYQITPSALKNGANDLEVSLSKNDSASEEPVQLVRVYLLARYKKQLPLIQAAEGLFDQSQPDSLGLAMVEGEHQVLYRAMKDGYKFCHHANLGVFDGKIYAMWSNGLVHEDRDGQRVLYCRSSNGVDWSKPMVLAEDPDGMGGSKWCMAAGFHAADESLVAYYSVSLGDTGKDTGNANLYAKTSPNGVQWDQPHSVALGTFMNAPRELRGRGLLLGGHLVNTEPVLMVSDEANGITAWRKADLPKSSELLYPEPTWFQRANGTIVMLFRSRTNIPWLYTSMSTDDGRTWSKPAKTDFPDATSRASAGNLPDGTAYIVSNLSRQPNSVYPSIGRRIPLTIALSRDGVTFDRAFVVRGEKTTMRFSGKNKLSGWQYPHATVWGEHLYIAYSVNKEDVGVTRIALRDLAP